MERVELMDDRPGTGSGITSFPEGDRTVVSLWGEVDAALRDAASDVMASLASRPTTGPVTIDASDVTFIDSSGIAFILQLFMLGQETGAEVALRRPAEPVVEVLEMIGMGGRIPVLRDEEGVPA